MFDNNFYKTVFIETIYKKLDKYNLNFLTSTPI